MKRPFIAVLPWMAAIILAVASCGGKDNTQNGGDPQPAAQGTTRTEGVLYMVSRLDGNTLFSSDADATAVDNYVKNTLKGSAGKEFTILDRVDGSGLVKANTIAVNNYRWIFHNIGRQVSKTDFQTSAVFMNSPQRDVHSLQAASTWFTFFNPTLKGKFIKMDADGKVEKSNNVEYSVKFYTGRISVPEEAAAFGGTTGTFSKIMKENSNGIVIGTVRNDLLTSLSDGVAAAGGKLTTVKDGSAYTIFMAAAERFWSLNGVEETTISGGINSYAINISWK